MRPAALLSLILLVSIAANGQTEKSKPSAKTRCGMSETTLNSIMSIANSMDTKAKAPDDQIDNVYRFWEQHLSEALKCQSSAQTSEDGLYAVMQLAALWGFRAKYDEIHAEALRAQIANLNTQVSNLQKVVGEPYINEPRPIHMICKVGGCDGEILIPNARSGDTPFHMTCRSGVGQVVCDGDLMP